MTIKIIHKSMAVAEAQIQEYRTAGYTIDFMMYFMGKILAILTDTSLPTPRTVKLIRKHKDKAQEAIQDYLTEGYTIDYITANGCNILAAVGLDAPVPQPIITGVSDATGGKVYPTTENISITGNGFGTSMAGSVALLDPSISIGAILNWSDTEITCGITGHEGLTEPTDVGVQVTTSDEIMSEIYTFTIMMI
jgi:hypothetical protein